MEDNLARIPVLLAGPAGENMPEVKRTMSTFVVMITKISKSNFYGGWKAGNTMLIEQSDFSEWVDSGSRRLVESVRKGSSPPAAT